MRFGGCFYYVGKAEMHPISKNSLKEQPSNRIHQHTMSNLFDNFDDMVDPPKKICIYCKQEKSCREFPKHIKNKDRLDTRCKSCIKTQSQLRAVLHKQAPPKPDVCECCGKPTTKFCLDHDHKTQKIRGWLCDPCNTGIGKLGDTLEGIEKALNYLKTHQQKETE